ncbi:MAG TPA: hypothetical protein VE442_16615 [Jatrophihabitans sp.]|nr:hypothetical protein [Jatrophihabitans sp.]
MDPDPDWYLDNVLINAAPGRFDRVDQSRVPTREWRVWWQRQWRSLGGDVASAIARDQGFVLTVHQLGMCGWAEHDLRREIRRGSWWSPCWGAASPVVVAPSKDGYLDARRRHAIASAAAALLRPGQVVSGRSAAILHGLPTTHVPQAPELTVAPPTTLGRRGSAHLYSATLGLDEVTTWYGTPVTTVGRTLVDTARHNARDGLMAADAALRARLVNREQISAALRAATGWPGVRRAREVLPLASPRAESALESVVRLTLYDAGFPTPELQVEVSDPKLQRVYRVDLLLREMRMIIEADGKGKYTDAELWNEKVREGRLRVLTRCRVERIIWADLTPANWPDTEQRLRLPPAA